MKVTTNQSPESGEMFIIFFSCWGDFLLMDCWQFPNYPQTYIQITNQRYPPAGSVYIECSHQTSSPRSRWGCSWWCRWWGWDWGWWRKKQQLRWKVCSPRQESWKLRLSSEQQERCERVRASTWSLSVPPCPTETHSIFPPSSPDLTDARSWEARTRLAGRLRQTFYSRNIFSITERNIHIQQIYFQDLGSLLVQLKEKFSLPRSRNIDW